MSIPKKIEKYLHQHKIDHKVVVHKTVYTAYDLAQTTKRKLSSIAKTIALKADQKYILVVLPATHRLDTVRLSKLLKVKKLRIVKEVELASVFKIKPGAIVPFATFHNVPIYVDKTLLKSRVVLVSGGSHTESLQLKAKTIIDSGAKALSGVSKKYLQDKLPKMASQTRPKRRVVKKGKPKRTRTVRKK